MSMNFGIPYGYHARRETFPSYMDNRHLCTIGPTRTGKGASVIIQALARVRHSAVVIDPKGQNSAVTARHRQKFGDVFVLNPFGLHCGAPWHLPKHRYNPLARLRIDDPNVAANAGALAQALIVTQSRDPYFDDTARDLVAALILHLVATRGREATLGDMRRLVTTIAARGPDAAALLNRMSRSPYAFIREPIGRFRDAEARDISSAVNTAVTQTAFLNDPAFSDPARGGALTASDFDFTQLKKRPTTVYLILPGRLMDTYGRFLRVLITSALDSVIEEAGGYPVLMLLHEFARLEALPAVTAAFSFAAAFNVQLWPFFQNTGQMQNVYGREWSTILANCGMVQCFTPADMDTAEYIQRRGGMTTGETRSRSYTGRIFKRVQSETSSETRMPLLPAERIMSMPGHESIVFFAGKHNAFLSERWPYWRIPRLAGMYDPNPYHS